MSNAKFTGVEHLLGKGDWPDVRLDQPEFMEPIPKSVEATRENSKNEG